MKRTPLFLFLLPVFLLLAGCMVGPDYQRPSAPMAEQYKPAKNWKFAEPGDDIPKGEWWKIYHDPTLDDLMAQVVPNNQNIAVYVARVREAQAVVSGSNANLYPSMSLNGVVQRAASGSSNKNLVNPDGTLNKGSILNNVNPSIGLSWDADIWGRLKRTLESSNASYAASLGDLENAQLSMQVQLAQAYFLLRSLDSQKVLLEKTTNFNKRTVDITQNAYDVGVKARQDVINATMQYRSVQAQLIDIGVNRAAQEYLIAVLIGQPPSNFSLPFNPLPERAKLEVPMVPLGIPSELLERRPDIAAAERRMAAANAQIGVNIAGYFPSLTLSPSYNNIGYQGSSMSQLFSVPYMYWSVGPSIAQTILNFGAISAGVEQARGTYDENVANYRQTVLSAMQDVETQAAALRILQDESVVQDEAADLSDRAVKIALNQYQAGITDFTSVVVAQNTALTNQQKAITIAQQRLNASVLLIKALGGSWSSTPKAASVNSATPTEPKAQNEQSGQNQQTNQRPGGQG